MGTQIIFSTILQGQESQHPSQCMALSVILLLPSSYSLLSICQIMALTFPRISRIFPVSGALCSNSRSKAWSVFLASVWLCWSIRVEDFLIQSMLTTRQYHSRTQGSRGRKGRPGEVGSRMGRERGQLRVRAGSSGFRGQRMAVTLRIQEGVGGSESLGLKDGSSTVNTKPLLLPARKQYSTVEYSLLKGSYSKLSPKHFSILLNPEAPSPTFKVTFLAIADSAPPRAFPTASAQCDESSIYLKLPLLSWASFFMILGSWSAPYPKVCIINGTLFPKKCSLRCGATCSPLNPLVSCPSDSTHTEWSILSFSYLSMVLQARSTPALILVDPSAFRLLTFTPSSVELSWNSASILACSLNDMSVIRSCPVIFVRTYSNDLFTSYILFPDILPETSITARMWMGVYLRSRVEAVKSSDFSDTRHFMCWVQWPRRTWSQAARDSRRMLWSRRMSKEEMGVVMVPGGITRGHGEDYIGVGKLLWGGPRIQYIKSVWSIPRRYQCGVADRILRESKEETQETGTKLFFHNYYRCNLKLSYLKDSKTVFQNQNGLKQNKHKVKVKRAIASILQVLVIT